MKYSELIKNAERALKREDRNELQKCFDGLSPCVNQSNWMSENTLKEEQVRDLRVKLAQKIWLLADKPEPEPEPEVVMVPGRPEDPYNGWGLGGYTPSN